MDNLTQSNTILPRRQLHTFGPAPISVVQHGASPPTQSLRQGQLFKFLIINLAPASG